MARAMLKRLSRRFPFLKGPKDFDPQDWVRVSSLQRDSDGGLVVKLFWPRDRDQPDGLKLVVAERGAAVSRSEFRLEVQESGKPAREALLLKYVLPPAPRNVGDFSWKTTLLESPKGKRFPISVSNLVLARFGRTQTSASLGAEKGLLVPMRTVAGRLALLPTNPSEAFLRCSEWGPEGWSIELSAPKLDASKWALRPTSGTKAGATVPLSIAEHSDSDGRVLLRGKVSLKQFKALYARSGSSWDLALLHRSSKQVVPVRAHPLTGAAPQALTWVRSEQGRILLPFFERDGHLGVQFVEASAKILGQRDRATVLSLHWEKTRLTCKVRIESASGIWDPKGQLVSVSLQLKGYRDPQEWYLPTSSLDCIDEAQWSSEYPEFVLRFELSEMSKRAILAGKSSLLSLSWEGSSGTWDLPLYWSGDSSALGSGAEVELPTGDRLGLDSNSQGRLGLCSVMDVPTLGQGKSIEAQVEKLRFKEGVLHLRGSGLLKVAPDSSARAEVLLVHSWARDVLSFDVPIEAPLVDSSRFEFEADLNLAQALNDASLWAGRWNLVLRVLENEGPVLEGKLQFHPSWWQGLHKPCLSEIFEDQRRQVTSVVCNSSGSVFVVVEALTLGEELHPQQVGGVRVLNARDQGDGYLRLQISRPERRHSEQSPSLFMKHPKRGEIELCGLVPDESKSFDGSCFFVAKVPRHISDVLAGDCPLPIFVTARGEAREPLTVSHLVLRRFGAQGLPGASSDESPSQSMLVPQRSSEGHLCFISPFTNEPFLSSVEWMQECLVLRVVLNSTPHHDFALELRAEAAVGTTAFPVTQTEKLKGDRIQVSTAIPFRILLEMLRKKNCLWDIRLRVGVASRVLPIRPHPVRGSVPQIIGTKTVVDGRLLALHANLRGGLSLQLMGVNSPFLQQQDIANAGAVRWNDKEFGLKIQLLTFTGAFDPGERGLSFALGLRGKRNPRLWRLPLRLVQGTAPSSSQTEYAEHELACDLDDLAGLCRLAGPTTQVSLLVAGEFGKRELPIIWNATDARDGPTPQPLDLGNQSFLLAEQDAKRRLRFVICPQNELAARGSPLEARLLSSTLRGSLFRLRGEARCSSTEFGAAKASLVLAKLNSDEVFSVPIALRVRTPSDSLGARTTFRAELNISKLLADGLLSDGKWEFRLRLVSMEGKVLERRLLRNLKGLQRRKAFQSHGRYRHVGSDLIVFPELRVSGQLVLVLRPLSTEDSWAARLRQAAAIGLSLVVPNVRDRKSWLITEKKSETAQDNSFVFFKYCYEHHPERRVFYLMRESSSQRDKLKGFESRVIAFGSLRHYLLLLRCGVLVSSEASSHFIEFNAQPSLFKLAVRIKKYVFLQHGVTAMKNVTSIFGRSGMWSADRFITTSPWEQEIAIKYLGYSAKQAPVAGFARWDLLTDKSAGKRQILMMPTWRNWLQYHTPEDFVSSEFFENYRGLLNSKHLSKLLEQHGAELLFVLHPYFSKFLDKMGELPSRVTLVKPEDRPINELLMESSLLVSDYSSVVWDFFKMKKPVIFFHFDSDEYLKQHGSFIDFNTELIGARALDVVAVVEEIGSALKNEFALSPEYLTAYERSFPVDDHKNCERIYAVTEQLQKESGHEFLKFLMSVLGLPKLKLKKRFFKLFSKGGS